MYQPSINEKATNISYKFHPYRTYVVSRFFKIHQNVRSIEQVIRFSEKHEVNLLVWSTRLKDEGIDTSNFNFRILRLEDGFIRSVGLGVVFTPPLSLVADPIGIYFDSTQPSYLEFILSKTQFNQEIRERAENLINKLLCRRINKYNVKSKGWTPPKTSKKLILVVGQVETDKSIKYGSPIIRTNLEFLKKVRASNPHEYIIYKPHPDVVGGYRKGGYPDEVLLEYADELCKDCDNFDLLSYVDEVHTITSLLGFEALLMGKKVFCYGQPFYSGWGLTEDLYPLKRRCRKLTIEELVAGALILYPMYVSLIDGRRLTPEEAVEEIELLKKKKPLKWQIYSMLQSMIKPLLKLRKL